MEILNSETSSIGFVYDFYRRMKNNKISFAYEGEISHEITKAFSSLAESHIAIDNESGTIQKKVFHVMVESLQNISKHSAERKENSSIIDGQGIFLISKTNNEYNITTGNVINREEIPRLQETIAEINASNKKNLNERYKDRIKKGKLSEKGGAGLGFIDIVRKTNEKLIYSFVEINEKKSYFIVTSTISRIKQ
jgi:hypothetical protein